MLVLFGLAISDNERFGTTTLSSSNCLQESENNGEIYGEYRLNNDKPDVKLIRVAFFLFTIQLLIYFDN